MNSVQFNTDVIDLSILLLFVYADIRKCEKDVGVFMCIVSDRHVTLVCSDQIV